MTSITPWYHKYPVKLLNDILSMEREFKDDYTLYKLNGDNKLRWRVEITRKEKYVLIIDHPVGYPFIQPKVKIFNYDNHGKLIHNTFEDNEHINPDGTLCLFAMDEGDSGWKHDNPISDVIYKFYTFLDYFKRDKISSIHSSNFDGPNIFSNISLIIPNLTSKILGDSKEGYFSGQLYSNFNSYIFALLEIVASDGMRKDLIIDSNFLNFCSRLKPYQPGQIYWYLVSPPEFNKIKKCNNTLELIDILGTNRYTQNERGIALYLSKSANSEDIQLYGVQYDPNKDSSPILNLQISYGEWDMNFHNRNHQLFLQVKKIFSNFTICIIGLGSLGGEVAVMLAKTGFENFYLIDPDVLSVENITRHILDIPFLFNYKVQAMKRKIEMVRPDSKITISDKNLLNPSVLEELNSYIEENRKNVIIINTTANIEVDHFLNSYGLENNIPIIYSYCSENVSMGRIFRVIPYKTPCYYCVSLAAKNKNFQTFPSKDESFERSAYIRGLPGIGIDITQIASEMSRFIFQTVLEIYQIKDVYPISPYDHYLIVLQNVEEFEIGKFGINIERNSECPICTESNEYDLLKEVTDKINGLSIWEEGLLK